MTPVAVIGMACRLPGGIDSPELLWKALLRGDDLITEVPPDRWDCDEFYDPQPGVPGRTVCKWGGFLDNPADFDCEFFGIGEREAIAIDPQQRLLLETSWEAMEHAGLTQQTLAGSATGVFAGVTHGDYTMVAADAKQLEEPYGYLGNSFSMASGRVAYAMRLHGPAITVDTACSSGLTAVHMACRSLHEGESDVALAGGVALMLEPRKAAAGSALGMLSPTGRCRAFDVAADGFVSGEGCAVVVLKRLPDALADGDRILAVIRGTSANQDGHTVNIATPSQPAQVAAYRAALAAGGVDAATVGMVEAHGPSGQPLDWFCLFSSAAALTGSPGQSAYSAANSWLDAFAHWRQAQGLPATAIAWGAWSDIGQLGWWSASPARASALEESNYTAITPDEGAYAFEALLRHNRVYTGYAPVIGAPWLVAFAERSRFFEVFSSSNGSGTSKFRVELNELPRDEWPARLRQLVAEQVSLILRRTVDPDRPLPEYGLDSLGALELRTRIETETGIRLAPKNVSATVRGLADHLYEQLAPDDAPAAALSSQ